MEILNDALLIASAPVELLLGLAVFFFIVALILFAQSIDEGHYPEVGRCRRRLGGFKFAPRLSRSRGFVSALVMESTWSSVHPVIKE
jgi:hypothetical protein